MKQILIILGHNRLTGVNTWAYTLGDFLIRRGHKIDFDIRKDFDYKPDIEGIYAPLNKLQITVYSKTLPDYNSYDYVIVNYNVHQKFVVPNKTIFVSHGSMFEPYKPFGKVYAHVAVSGRTQEILKADLIIHNGIDLEKFRPTKFAKTPPQKALNIFRGIPNYSLYKSCVNLNIELKHIASSEDVGKQIKNYDIIIGYGRSAYEGMSAGKPVLVSGPFGTDGWIKPENFERFLYRNCSGWAGRTFPNLQELTEFLQEGDTADGMANRKLAKKYLDAEIMADKFEELF